MLAERSLMDATSRIAPLPGSSRHMAMSAGSSLAYYSTEATPLLPVPELPADTLSFHYVENLFGEANIGSLLASKAPAPSGEFMSRRDFWQFRLKNIHAFNDEGHGCTSRPLPKSTWQMIFSAVNQMDDVAAGLRHFAELVVAMDIGIFVSIGYGRQGVHLNFAHSGSHGSAERMERYLELVALVFHCALLWMTGRSINPVQIRLSSMLSDQDGSLLAGLAPHTARQGEGCTIVYDRSDLSWPLGVRKYQHWSSETKAFEELSLSFWPDGTAGSNLEVVEKVRHLVMTRGLTRQEIAKTMAMSMATLQRRLREAGTSYRDISKEVRCDRLIALLATDINFDDLAEELGLSERRSLWRTCKEWLGVSPSEYRKSICSQNLKAA